MGLFSSVKKTSVSATVLNLAGDKVESFIRQTVFLANFNETSPNFSKALLPALFGSTGFKIRKYFSWCQKNKKGQEFCRLIGHYYTSFNSDINSEQLANYFKNVLNLPESQNVIIDTIRIDQGDFYYWGAKYLDENYPQYTRDDVYQRYTFDCSYDYSTNVIKIHIYDSIHNSDEIRTLEYTPSNFDNTKRYLYVAYQIYDLIPVDVSHDHGPSRIEYIEPDPPPVANNLTYFIYAENTSINDPNYNAALSNIFTLINQEDDERTFLLPPIPFRLDNKQISDTDKTHPQEWALYQRCKDASFKVFNDRKTYTRMDKNLLKNENLSKLDYIYMFFGVSINTQNWAGKQYLYNFVAMLFIRYSTSNKTEMVVRDQEDRNSFLYKIRWNDIESGTMGAGEEFPTIPNWAKKAFSGSEKYAVYREKSTLNPIWNPNASHTEWIYFIHRKFKNSKVYSFYRVSGFVHQNYAHKGHDIWTWGAEAFDYKKDSNGKEIYEESPFLFPLHEGIFRDLPALTQAQLSMSFAYLVFNCYEIHHAKWYTREWVRVVIASHILAAQAVAFYFSLGTSSGPIQGLTSALTSMLSTVVSQTAAQAMAVLLTRIINMLVTVILTKLIAAGLKALGLDNLFANLIAMVAAIVATWGMNQALNQQFPAQTTTTTATSSVTTTPTTDVSSTTSVETATTSSTTTATTTPTESKSLFELAKQDLFNFLTSPIKLLSFALAVTDTGIKSHYQGEQAKLKEKASAIEELQPKLLAVQDELSEYQEWSDWAKQVIIWKIQTSIQPEDYFTMSLVSGSDVADITINYLDSFLDVSNRLEYIA